MKWFDDYGNCVKNIPSECVTDCSHSGDCESDCIYWVNKLDFTVPREKTVQYMREFGAWSVEELNEKSDSDLAVLVLWVACCEIAESGEWFGLVH